APRRLRVSAAFAITLLQSLIPLTGNYAFFNLLTITICLFLLDDTFFRRCIPGRILSRIPQRVSESSQRPLVRRSCFVLYAMILFASGFQLVSTFSGRHWAPSDKIITALAPFEIVNTYGLFAVMTTTRAEIILQGSNDGKTWFAALGDYRSNPWILRLLARILEASPDVLKLMGSNPFPNAAPRYVRATLYRYDFTTPNERKSTGKWWGRELTGEYIPVVSLKNPS